MVPDFYHNQAMKPVEWSKIPDFLAKFPVDKACAAFQDPLYESFATRPAQSCGFITSTWSYMFYHFLLCMAGPTVSCFTNRFSARFQGWLMLEHARSACQRQRQW